MLAAAIIDVDGVLLASPHQRAWREALVGFADPEAFTTEIYQAVVAGKPRLAGARAALETLGVADVERQAPVYAARKQTHLMELIEAGQVQAFPDALRFVELLLTLKAPLAVASSSKNANTMLRMINLPGGGSLLEAFRVNVCGRDFSRGKPDPEIFDVAARELGMAPAQCFVAEDAPAGIVAARAGGMKALGVARLRDEVGLRKAHADLVVATLDDVDPISLAKGQLRSRASL